MFGWPPGLAGSGGAHGVRRVWEGKGTAGKNIGMSAATPSFLCPEVVIGLAARAGDALTPPWAALTRATTAELRSGGAGDEPRVADQANGSWHS